jgi:hypothetical protein
VKLDSGIVTPYCKASGNGGRDGHILRYISERGRTITHTVTAISKKYIRVVQKLKFLNNNRLKTAKCGALKPTGFLAGLVREPTGFLNKSSVDRGGGPVVFDEPRVKEPENSVEL